MFAELVKDCISVTEWAEMQDRMNKGERCGQAFFNSISPEWKERLRGSLFDPFYRTNYVDVVMAIDFLTK